MTKYPDLFNALMARFADSDVKTLPKGGKNLLYITARTCMNRLDDVLGPENWWDEYVPMEHSVLCKLSIRLPDGSILTKCDAGGYAGMTDQGDDDKSGFSDALKRAAAKFGVARYLYRDGVPEFEPKPHHAVNHDNETGHGVGAYAAPEVVKEYQDWITKTCEDVNSKWLDDLTGKFGEIPDKAPAEVISTWQLSGHLLKWGRSRGLVNAPDDTRAGQRDKFAAVLWLVAQRETMDEAREYCRKLWRQARGKVKPAREPGCDDGPDIDEAMDKLAEEGVTA